MKRDWQPVFLVFKREVRDILRDWRILFPIIILTLFFPFLMNIAAKYAVSFAMKYEANVVASRMIPFFVLVVGFFPATISMVVALETFVGEKERGTIEPLLITPLEDWQLYVGKFLSALSLPLSAAFLDIGIYLLILVLRGFAMPPNWILLDTLLLTFAEALVMVSGAIFLSVQATTVRGANLLASFIILPMSLLLELEAVLLFWGTQSSFWLAFLALVILAYLFIRLGLAHFSREQLLNRRAGPFSLSKIGRSFWHYFTGDATSLAGWYGHIFRKLKQMRLALGVTVFLGILAAAVAFVSVRFGFWHIQALDHEALQDLSQEFFTFPVDVLTPGFLFKHNLQAMSVLAFLGFISFSLMGWLLYFLNLAVVGAVLGGVSLLGYSAGRLFLYGILPHGIFELSALALLMGSLFYAGAVLFTPQLGRGIADIFMEVFADVLKIFLGLVIPLLVVAAFMEAYVSINLLIFMR